MAPTTVPDAPKPWRRRVPFVNVGDCDAPSPDESTSAAFGKSEVENLDQTVRRDLDVGRLEVPMNDTLLVRRFEPIGNLLRQKEGFVQRKRTARDPLGEGLALDELHDEELLAFAFFEAVESGDVRVVELSEQPSFALEPGQPLFVSGKLFGEDLDRDIPAELPISSSIHFAHPTFANELEDLVMREVLPGALVRRS